MEARVRGVWRGAAALLAAMVLTSCGGGPTPSPGPDLPGAGGGAAPPGAIAVTGRERLAWQQSGNSLNLRFIAYVNGVEVGLDAATCQMTTDEWECSAPLPALPNGLHTITVAAVSLVSGLAGPTSEELVVWKVSALLAGAQAAGQRPRATGDGPAKTPGSTSATALDIEVVAEGLRGPVQLAPAPDGRVFVAEADGRVRILAAGAVEPAVAYDARAALYPSPIGPVGIVMHPSFADNGFVYLSFLAEERAGEVRLRILRLREVGGTLGEAATVYEGPVMMDSRAASDADQAGTTGLTAALEGPRLAFAPSGLLHALLPLGLRFDDPTMASWPHASVVRLADDGGRPDEGALGGITTHPLALTWRPGTNTLWGVFSDAASIAAARPVERDASVQALDDAGPVLHIVDGDPAAARGLALDGATPDTMAWAQAFMAGAGLGVVTPIRLSASILLDPFLSGTPGELTDVVSTGDGALLLGMNGADRATASILRVRLRN